MEVGPASLEEPEGKRLRPPADQDAEVAISGVGAANQSSSPSSTLQFVVTIVVTIAIATITTVFITIFIAITIVITVIITTRSISSWTLPD